MLRQSLQMTCPADILCLFRITATFLARGLKTWLKAPITVLVYEASKHFKHFEELYLAEKRLYLGNGLESEIMNF